MKNQIPSKDSKKIIIEDVEYIYSISKLENKDGISIILKELKHKKNIKFIYEALKDKLTNDIKQLLVCENIDEMINIIKDMIDTGNITVEKREDKYIMIIEIYYPYHLILSIILYFHQLALSLLIQFHILIFFLILQFQLS